MAVIELVRESTVTTEANRANRVAASKKADDKPAKAAESRPTRLPRGESR